ncbi:unnamed protein product [Ectocarpus sp. 13 AM-2016]
MRWDGWQTCPVLVIRFASFCSPSMPVHPPLGVLVQEHTETSSLACVARTVYDSTAVIPKLEMSQTAQLTPWLGHYPSFSSVDNHPLNYLPCKTACSASSNREQVSQICS